MEEKSLQQRVCWLCHLRSCATMGRCLHFSKSILCHPYRHTGHSVSACRLSGPFVTSISSFKNSLRIELTLSLFYALKKNSNQLSLGRFPNFPKTSWQEMGTRFYWAPCDSKDDVYMVVCTAALKKKYVPCSKFHAL